MAVGGVANPGIFEENTPPRSPRNLKKKEKELEEKQSKSPTRNSGNERRLMLGGERQQKR